MSESFDLFHRLKSESSISLQSHNNGTTEMLRPRSSTILLSRSPSYPALAPDLSAELARETAERRRLHSAVLKENPGAFRRQQKPESASAFMHTIQLNKDLLDGMHALKDPRDIDKTKKFTRSRLFEKQERDRALLDEYHYKHMYPLEDFIRPEDSTTLRKTGYEHGHIRSLLKLDTYGPANSAEVLRNRAMGELPQSPNLDRHLLVSPAYPLRPSALPTHDGGSSVSSRQSSMDSSTNYRGVFPSIQKLRRSMSHDSDGQHHRSPSGTPRGHPAEGGDVDAQRPHADNLRDLFHGSSLVSPGEARSRSSHTSRLNSPGSTNFSGPNLSPPGSRHGHSRGEGSQSRAGSRGSARLPSGDATFAGKAITEHERILKDPHLRRHAWFKTYQERNNDKKSRKDLRKKTQQHRKEQQRLANMERDSISSFEDHLVLAKFEP